MDNLIKAGGWILALVGFAAGGYYVPKYYSAQEELVLLKSQVQGLRALLEKAQEPGPDGLTAREQMYNEHRDGVDTALIQPRPTDSAESPSPEAVETAKLEPSEGQPAATPGAPMANMMQNMAKMFEGEKGEEMLQMTVQMQLEMMYGPLFQELGLAEEQAAQVRAILGDSLEGQITAGMELMKDGMSDPVKGAELKGAFEADKVATRSRLEEVLTPEQMAAYDAYEAEKPRRMLEQQFTMQLQMLAPGFDEESRQVVAETIADEMLASGQDFTSGMPPSDMNAVFDAQMAALERARASLMDQMTEEQLRQFDNFTTQLRVGLEFARQMFNTGEAQPGANAPAEPVPVTDQN